MESNLAPGKSPWLWRAEAPPGASLLGRSPRASVNVESNLVSGKCPRGCSAPRPHPELPSWLEECNLEPGKCPRGFSARRPRPELPLLGQSPRASVSRWVNVEPNLEPGKCPRLRRPEAPCWVEVLEQVSSAGSICNLTWSPLSVPVALAPGGSGRRSSQREGYNEKMKNVTSMVGKWEKYLYNISKIDNGFIVWIDGVVYSLCFDYVFDVFVKCVEGMLLFFSCVCVDVWTDEKLRSWLIILYIVLYYMIP